MNVVNIDILEQPNEETIDHFGPRDWDLFDQAPPPEPRSCQRRAWRMNQGFRDDSHLSGFKEFSILTKSDPLEITSIINPIVRDDEPYAITVSNERQFCHREGEEHEQKDFDLDHRTQLIFHDYFLSQDFCSFNDRFFLFVSYYVDHFAHQTMLLTDGAYNWIVDNYDYILEQLGLDRNDYEILLYWKPNFCITDDNGLIVNDPCKKNHLLQVASKKRSHQASFDLLKRVLEIIPGNVDPIGHGPIPKSKNKSCSICFSRFEKEDKCVTLFCGHRFHISCYKYFVIFCIRKIGQEVCSLCTSKKEMHHHLTAPIKQVPKFKLANPGCFTFAERYHLECIVYFEFLVGRCSHLVTICNDKYCFNAVSKKQNVESKKNGAKTICYKCLASFCTFCGGKYDYLTDKNDFIHNNLSCEELAQKRLETEERQVNLQILPDTTACPNCKAIIVRDKGCPIINCAACKTVFSFKLAAVGELIPDRLQIQNFGIVNFDQ